MDPIEASREEATKLRGQSVSEVTPSRRDFSQYVAGSKDQPAVIARLTLKAAGWARAQLLTHARACDDAEVAAVSLSLFDDLTAEDLAATNSSVTAPILREDPLLDANQLYYSRLHGIDAVVLPADVLDAADLARLVDVAVSMHMGVIVECSARAAVETALRWPYTIIGVRRLDAAREFGRLVPATRTVVLLSTIASREEYDAARGLCDAVIAGPNVLNAADVVSSLEALQLGGAPS
jgi:indole-3-glycerol phosphate synthase